MRALQIQDVSFHYPQGPLLFQGVALQVTRGECVVLTGSSGAGKSTLCLLCSGIIPRSIPGSVKGEILLFGKPLNNLSLTDLVRQVGMVFQDPDFQLFSPTVEDELAFGPENLCLSKHEIGERIAWALEAVQMTQYRTYAIQDLSQGQKQLIALAAVLTLRPEILILDEIFAPLDQTAAQLVMEVISQYKAAGKAVLVVDHSGGALNLADRVFHLKREVG